MHHPSFSRSFSLSSLHKTNRKPKGLRRRKSLHIVCMKRMLKTCPCESTLDSVEVCESGSSHLDPWSFTRHVSSIGWGSTRSQDGRTFSISRGGEPHSTDKE